MEKIEKLDSVQKAQVMRVGFELSQLGGIVTNLAQIYEANPWLNEAIDIQGIIPMSLDEWVLEIKKKMAELLKATVHIPTHEEIAELTRLYVGKRIKCIFMPRDPAPILPGTEGRCVLVDGLGHLCMSWDDGRDLSLVPGVDEFVIV